MKEGNPGVKSILQDKGGGKKMRPESFKVGNVEAVI